MGQAYECDCGEAVFSDFATNRVTNDRGYTHVCPTNHSIWIVWRHAGRSCDEWRAVFTGVRIEAMKEYEKRALALRRGGIRLREYSLTGDPDDGKLHAQLPRVK